MECNLVKNIASCNGNLLIPELFIARTPWQRTRGLLGHTPLTNVQGLLIEKCHSVHMIGMTYAIDLVYLDKSGIVLKTVDNFKPWRFSACVGASCVIEILNGMNQKLNIVKGKRIEWS